MTISTDLVPSTPRSAGHWANRHTHPNTHRVVTWIPITGSQRLLKTRNYQAVPHYPCGRAFHISRKSQLLGLRDIGIPISQSRCRLRLSIQSHLQNSSRPPGSNRALPPVQPTGGRPPPGKTVHMSQLLLPAHPSSCPPTSPAGQCPGAHHTSADQTHPWSSSGPPHAGGRGYNIYYIIAPAGGGPGGGGAAPRRRFLLSSLPNGNIPARSRNFS
jgi:hypothetical protein